ncbi:hypothetical protein HWI79_3266 [Cryptosporidium felis]|nr:hypothetical protein HWI79_3266 [Cryptosporidium felis]
MGPPHRQKENGEQNAQNREISSLLIDSLRNQVSKVSAFNKFHYIKNSRKPCETEKDSQIGNIADRIRNAISINRLNSAQRPGCNESSFHNQSEDVFSPFRKRNKSSERSLLQNKVFSFNQAISEQDNILLHTINKMRFEQIRLKNREDSAKEDSLDRPGSESGLDSEPDAYFFFPQVYTPLYPIKLLNLQELYLFIWLFYKECREETQVSAPNSNLPRLLFFSPEKVSVSQFSTVLSGRITHYLDHRILFPNEACAGKLFLNSVK